MNWDDAFDEITELYQSELYEEALALCVELLDEELETTERGHVLRRMGECQFRLDRPLSALSLFDEAEEFLGDDATGLGLLELDRAIVAREMGDFVGSEKHFSAARGLVADEEFQAVVLGEYQELQQQQQQALRQPNRYQFGSAAAQKWITQLKA
jgi:tetratricopeptide (TPR) repeat protein